MPKFKKIDDLKNYKANADLDKTKILVGMGTCGIAAGADKVLKKFKDQVKMLAMKNVEVKQVGCLGLCFSEPNVEVIKEGMPDVLYGKVDLKFTIKIIEEHIINSTIINENIYDKPYINIYA